MPGIDYYSILGVDPMATPQEIFLAYDRAINKAYYRFQTYEECNMHQSIVVEAYRVLIDPRRRAAYDLGLMEDPDQVDDPDDPDLDNLDDSALAGPPPADELEALVRKRIWRRRQSMYSWIVVGLLVFMFRIGAALLANGQYFYVILMALGIAVALAVPGMWIFRMDEGRFMGRK